MKIIWLISIKKENRMLICGKVVNSVGYEQSGGGYKYKVKIRKANGRDTTFITNKEILVGVNTTRMLYLM